MIDRRRPSEKAAFLIPLLRPAGRGLLFAAQISKRYLGPISPPQTSSLHSEIWGPRAHSSASQHKLRRGGPGGVLSLPRHVPSWRGRMEHRCSSGALRIWPRATLPCKPSYKRPCSTIRQPAPAGVSRLCTPGAQAELRFLTPALRAGAAPSSTQGAQSSPAVYPEQFAQARKPG